MIRGIIITLVVLIILHFFGINIDMVITRIAGELIVAWQWIAHTIKSI